MKLVGNRQQIKSKLINLIEKHTYFNKNKINKVGITTLKKLKDDKLKIVLYSDTCTSKYKTRYQKLMYGSIGYCLNKHTIAFNNTIDFTDNCLAETCVHEINDTLNLKLFNDSKITFCYNEFLAHVAEYLYVNNLDLTELKQNQIEEIKKTIYQAYSKEYSKFVNKDELNKINSVTVGKII